LIAEEAFDATLVDVDGRQEVETWACLVESGHANHLTSQGRNKWIKGGRVNSFIKLNTNVACSTGFDVVNCKAI